MQLTQHLPDVAGMVVDVESILSQPAHPRTVHKGVSSPSASGPRFNTSTSSFNRAPLSNGWRPSRLAFFTDAPYATAHGLVGHLPLPPNLAAVKAYAKQFDRRHSAFL
jgi:hypothetical protein